MKNIVMKAIFILILVVVIFSINTKVHAWSEIISEGKDFISTGEKSGEASVDPKAVQEL